MASASILFSMKQSGDEVLIDVSPSARGTFPRRTLGGFMGIWSLRVDKSVTNLDRAPPCVPFPP